MITFEMQAPYTGLITINRPEVRNALSRAAMIQLGEAIAAAYEQPDLRVLILTGAGEKAFISGGDLRDLYDESSEAGGLRQHDLMTTVLNRLAELPCPVIAAMEGATRGGGCEVALACDMRIAAADATLGFAQVHMAVTPGWGGAERLYQQVGYAHAMDLLLTGRTLSADEALMLGLVDRITEPGQALHEGIELAAYIASNPPLAIRGIKAVLQGYRGLPQPQARARERSIFGQLWGSADHAEASAAFLEKRDPDFRGA